MVTLLAGGVAHPQDQAVPEWKIRGALAAFADGSPGVKSSALDHFRELKVLDRVERRLVEPLLDDAAARPAAIRALGAMGAADLRPRFLTYANSSGSEADADGCAAIEALSDIKAPESNGFLLEALKTDDPTSCRSFVALEAIRRNKAGPSSNDLAPLAAAGNAAAFLAIGYIGDSSQIPFLMAHFRDKTDYAVSLAGEALGELGELKISAQIPAIEEMLKDKIGSVRAGAVEALGHMYAPRFVEIVAPFLNDPDKNVQGAACRALGDLQALDYTRQIAGKVSSVPSQTGTDLWVRDCIYALGALRASQYAGIVASHLTAFATTEAVVEALTKMGATDQQGTIVAALASDRLSLPNGATSIRQLTPAEILHLLSYVYDETSRSDNLRALAYFGSGGDPDSIALIQWLGDPPLYQFDNLDRSSALRIMAAFRRNWSAATKYPRLQDDIEEQTAGVITAVGLGWRPDDVSELQRMVDLLRSVRNRKGGSTRADAVVAVINRVRTKQWTLRIVAILAIHASFWAAFFFLYPKFAPVRAIFFWNPWVRKIGGLAYVGALLTWTPFLRRRLFQPFRSTLIEDSATSPAIDRTYFPESEVKLENGELLRLDSALALKKGRIVLEGESGLGKTMFLRHLINSSNRLTVFLPAAKCVGGVIEAIEEKLASLPKDTNFLQTLVYSGALDVVIDGLNEVSPNTVANVRAFLSSNDAANIIVTTQPIDWKIPSRVIKYVLQPLSRLKVEEFLVSRESLLPAGAPVRGDAYRNACAKFVQQVIGDGGDPAMLTASRVLSNPMDLTVVASMLSQGSAPDLSALQQQQYDLMANEYKMVSSDREFPLRAFSAKVFEMRFNDRQELPSTQMMAEIPLLEKHKMIFRRVLKDDKGADVMQWYFRHDKIQDFFLLQVFLSVPGKQEEYIDDARFRGVYFLLAARLPIPEANTLRELLIDRAVDTRDHSVSDGFIRRLRERQAISV